MNPRLLALGDGALTLEFGDRIDPDLNARVMTTRDALAAMGIAGINDVVPTYRSLTVHFDPLRLDRELLSARLQQAAQAPPQESAPAGPRSEISGRQRPTRWLIPVVFGDEFGPDLSDVARATGRSEADIIDVLCATELRVFLIGFLPGFPYLGELPEWLRLPRRPTPRTAVAENSLAIAGSQAAVYPWQSPGGWHLLGRTPARLFDLSEATRPALLAPGDRVRFAPVGREEFQRMAADVEAGRMVRHDWQVT